MVGVEGPPFIHLCGSRLLTKPRTGTTCSLVLLMPPACVGALPGGRIRSLLCLCWLVISSVTVLCLSSGLSRGTDGEWEKRVAGKIRNRTATERITRFPEGGAGGSRATQRNASTRRGTDFP